MKNKTNPTTERELMLLLLQEVNSPSEYEFLVEELAPLAELAQIRGARGERVSSSLNSRDSSCLITVRGCT